MPGIVGGALVAHPPILLPAVGGTRSGLVDATFKAMHQLDASLAGSAADLVIMASPHSPVDASRILFRRPRHVFGDLSRFRAGQVRLELELDVALATGIVESANEAGFPAAWAEDGELDHGVVVPLSILEKTRAGRPFVLIGICGWPQQQFFEFGAWLHRHLRDRSALFVASGDLSHRLSPSAPAGYREEGRVFDRLVIDSLRDNDWDRITAMDPDFVEEAGECGLRPLMTLLGASRAAGLTSSVLNYEGPFGVGYPVVHFAPQAAKGGEQLARAAIEHYLRTREVIEPSDPIAEALRPPSAVFVTLRKGGELRGCVGTTRPTMPSAAREIVRYAISAAVRDPRFEPLALGELDGLTIEVQLLDPPEKVTGLEELDPARYGIIVRGEGQQGLLLPGLDGIDTAEEQVAAACVKAGISRMGPLEIFRFSVHPAG